MSRIEGVREKLAGTEYLSLLEFWEFDALARDLSPATIRGYWEAVGTLFRYAIAQGIEAEDLSKLTIQKWIISQKGKVRGTTVNARLRHFRAFWSVLEREDMLPGMTNPMATIRNIRAEKLVKRIIQPSSISQVVRFLGRQRTFAAKRNRVMVLILWECMIRLSELIGMTTDCILWDQRLIRVYGKGRMERLVPYGPVVQKVLHKYVYKERRRVPGEQLFCSEHGEQMKPENIRRILMRLDKVAGQHISPHLIRHSAATWYATQPGVSLAVLQRILGHSSLTVTQEYIHMSAAAAVKAYQTLSPSRAIRL